LNDSRPDSVLAIGEVEMSLMDWLTKFLTTLRKDLLRHSTLELGRRETLEAMVGVPANANSNQRFLTMEAFRQAGFEVIGMLNEPSAAGIEYAHRYRQTDFTRRREHVVVYDLGGGTFDVSIIRMIGQWHEVIQSQGISRLGGDDFDEILMDLAVQKCELPEATVKDFSRARLQTLCREAKESINPNTRKITVDLGQIHPESSEVLIPTSEFYGRCEPLIARTIGAMESSMQSVLGDAAADFQSLACVYLVGGSCELPILARSLRERFGKRVRRSPYPSAATAIGLAIAADQKSGYTLEDRFSRYFGVWRENDHGLEIVFDPIFSKQTELPRAGQPQLTTSRRYHPVHNVGHFRFIECSNLKDQQPMGDIISWDDVFFPFDPGLAEEDHLERIPVERMPEAEPYCVEEVYRCDAQGIIEVTISNQSTGLAKTFRIRQ
jgi:molecular chaperone DnaK (HSP70)